MSYSLRCQLMGHTDELVGVWMLCSRCGDVAKYQPVIDPMVKAVNEAWAIIEPVIQRMVDAVNEAFGGLAQLIQEGIRAAGDEVSA